MRWSLTADTYPREASMTSTSDDAPNDECIPKILAEFSSGITYEDLSPEVVDWAKYLCLDFAGVTLNGSTTD